MKVVCNCCASPIIAFPARYVSTTSSCSWRTLYSVQTLPGSVLPPASAAELLHAAGRRQLHLLISNFRWTASLPLKKIKSIIYKTEMGRSITMKSRCTTVSFYLAYTFSVLIKHSLGDMRAGCSFEHGAYVYLSRPLLGVAILDTH